MQFLCSIWKILHLTEYFYTGTAHGARNNYQVCCGQDDGEDADDLDEGDGGDLAHGDVERGELAQGEEGG